MWKLKNVDAKKVKTVYFGTYFPEVMRIPPIAIMKPPIRTTISKPSKVPVAIMMMNPINIGMAP